MSISRKLILAFLIVSSIPLIVFTFFYSITTEQSLHKEIIDQLELLAIVQEDRVNRMLERSKDNLSILAHDPRIIDLTKSNPLETSDERKVQTWKIITKLLESLKDFKSITLLDNTGTVVASTRLDMLGKDLSAERFFSVGRKRVDVTSFMHFGEKGLGSIMVRPIKSDGSLIGVLVVESDLMIRSALNNYSGFGNRADSYLVKRLPHDIALLTPLPFGIKASLRKFIEIKIDEAGSVIQNALSRQNQSLSDVTDHNGKSVLSAIRQIRGTSWALVVNVAEEDALAPVFILRAVLWNVTAIFLALVLFAGVLVSRSITRPIVRFEEAAHRIADGNLNDRIHINSLDEIGSLAKAFNRMTEYLADSYEKLEQRVREKTKELSIKNEQLAVANQHFQKEMDEARHIQESLLPENLPRDERFDVAVTYLPLQDVGGDWYYLQKEESGKISGQIADVTGHGLSAAFVGSMGKLAMYAADQEKPADLLQEMNRLMVPQLPEGRFITMFSFLYDPENGELDLARAGHPPAIIYNRKDNKVLLVKGEGFPLGFFEDAACSEERAKLDVGDVMILYTDGVCDAHNSSNETYGSNRIGEVLRQTEGDLSASNMIIEILQDFDRFRNGEVLKDDVTLLLLKRVK